MIWVYWSIEKGALEMKHLKTEEKNNAFQSLEKKRGCLKQEYKHLIRSRLAVELTHWSINLGSLDRSRFIEHASTAMQMIFTNANFENENMI